MVQLVPQYEGVQNFLTRFLMEDHPNNFSAVFFNVPTRVSSTTSKAADKHALTNVGYR